MLPHSLDLQCRGQTRSKQLDPFAEKLTTWLQTAGTKLRKQRRNLNQIHKLQIHHVDRLLPMHRLFIYPKILYVYTVPIFVYSIRKYRYT